MFFSSLTASSKFYHISCNILLLFLTKLLHFKTLDELPQIIRFYFFMQTDISSLLSFIFSKYFHFQSQIFYIEACLCLISIQNYFCFRDFIYILFVYSFEVIYFVILEVFLPKTLLTCNQARYKTKWKNHFSCLF